ncbi:beta-ketoacyl synthase N-terminal-like domain-containing protein, partial [Actinosynnema sp. NPDC059797]
MSGNDDFGVAGADEGIAVVGMAGRFPGAADVAEFWRNLCRGRDCVTDFSEEELAEEVPPDLLRHPDYVRSGAVLEGVDLFDAGFFGCTPREAQVMDPQQRLFLEQAWHALEDAGWDTARLGGQVGVFAGAALSTYLLNNLLPDRALTASVGAVQLALANDKDSLSTRTSYLLGLTGPAYSVQSYCSTSLVAVCAACTSLAAGECDAALAGGVAVSVPQRVGYLYQEGGMASPDGRCRAFDAAALGTPTGSGVGVVVLKRLDDALRDGDHVHAVIRGWAVNNDGSVKAGFTAPAVRGQAAVIAEAIAGAGLSPDDIDYVEAHGTGTALGDAAELAALRQAFGPGPAGSCALGSVKTNVGHLDRAAGVAGLIKAVLSVRHGVIPPSLGFERPNPELDRGGRFFVNTALRDWPETGRPRRAGVSAFGIGGTNAHVVLEEPHRGRAWSAARGDRVLVVSARRG